jgi:hypothetical protein
MGRSILDTLPPLNEGRQDNITHVPNHVPLKCRSRMAPTHNTRAVTVGRSIIGLEDWKQTLKDATVLGARELLESCLNVFEVGVCEICSLLHCCRTDGIRSHLLKEQPGYEGLCFTALFERSCCLLGCVKFGRNVPSFRIAANSITRTDILK